MTKVVHCQKESYDVYIGRPSIFGNPFKESDGITRAEAVEKYRNWVLYDDEAETVREKLPSLQGKILGCWCKPKLCHGDVIVEIVDGNILELLGHV